MSHLQAWLDFDDNGFLAAADEITEWVMEMSWNTGMRTPYQVVADSSTAQITVANADKRWTPENTSSPYWGGSISKIQPGKPVRITTTTGGTLHSPVGAILWVGELGTPAITLNYGEGGTASGAVSATLNCVDLVQQLKELPIALGTYENTNAGTVITDVLEATGFSAAGVQAGIQALTRYGDDPDVKAYEVIEEVAKTEYGRFFIGPGGTPQFYNRHELATRYTNNSSTVTSQPTQGATQYTSIGYTYGALYVNHISVEINPRRVGGTVTLWTLDDTLVAPSSGTVNYKAILRKEDSQFSAAGSLAIGTLVFSSGTCTVTVTPEGGKANIELDNGANTEEAVISEMTLEGAPQLKQNKVVYETEVPGGTTLYGVRPLDIRLTALSTVEDARYIADWEIFRRITDPTYFGEVSVVNMSAQVDQNDAAYRRMNAAFGTRVHVLADNLSHGADYFIIGARHTVRFPDMVQFTQLTMEPVHNKGGTVTFWELGNAGRSNLGISTHLLF